MSFFGSLFGRKPKAQTEELNEPDTSQSLPEPEQAPQEAAETKSIQESPSQIDSDKLRLITINEKLDKIYDNLAKHDEKMSVKIDNLPDQIMPLLKQYRLARTPVAKKSVAEAVIKRMRFGVDELIDIGLITIIKEFGQISSLELMEQAQKRGVCASASVYRHLDKLVAEGKLNKKRFKKRVLYSLPGGSQPAPGTEDTAQIGIQTADESQKTMENTQENEQTISLSQENDNDNTAK